MNLLVEVVSRIESMVNRTTQEEEEGEDRHIGPILHHQENCEKGDSKIDTFYPLIIDFTNFLGQKGIMGMSLNHNKFKTPPAEMIRLNYV